MTADQDFVITYSPALTLVPTYECFNRCTYCNFRTEPGQSPWLTLTEARQRLEVARSQGVVEILVLSGEVHPKSYRRSAWIQHVYDLCALALEMGFLPHTNVGPLNEAEMTLLKSVNVSMGLMLEQITPALLKTVHHRAPSKVPALRLQQLAQAGKLKIPFTTGLLLGIGESDQDRLDTLEAIATCHRQWGHIQEVILQPHQPGQHQTETRASFSTQELIAWIKIARTCLPDDITIQIPPNLVGGSRKDLLQTLKHGARDLGGLSPVDEVNPDYPHPKASAIAQTLRSAGWELQPRLPVYPHYQSWLSADLQSASARCHERLLQLKTSLETIATAS